MISRHKWIKVYKKGWLQVDHSKEKPYDKFIAIVSCLDYNAWELQVFLHGEKIAEFSLQSEDAKSALFEATEIFNRDFLVSWKGIDKPQNIG